MRIRKIPLRIRPDLDPPPQTVKLSEKSFKLSVYEYHYKLWSKREIATCLWISPLTQKGCCKLSMNITTDAREMLQLVYEYHHWRKKDVATCLWISQDWEFAHLLILLKSNERLWAIRSDRSRQMSNCELIAQVAQDKWATMSQSLMINEEWAICSKKFD